MIYLREDLATGLGPNARFERIMAMEGEIFRDLAGRRTLCFVLHGRRFFLKIHRGVGWKEIFKNLFQMRLPVLGAQNEWLAIKRLEKLGIDTMRLAGYGRRGQNPARLHSFVITEALENTVSLEDYCRNWTKQPPTPKLKRMLIKKLATVARQLHQNGINHRDFYICHFLLEPKTLENEGLADYSMQSAPKVYLIDLHRVQIRRKTPRRWIVKDLAGIFFSAMDIGLTSRDYYRFMMIYRQKKLREIVARETSFWNRVRRRAIRLYQKDFKRLPELPL
jgi:heptose I phosphotransferase